MQYTGFFFKRKKNENFIRKKCDIFNILAQNIHCGYTLEPPRRGGSNEYPQCMFWIKNKKIRFTPLKPQFFNVKVGFDVVYIARTCFPDGSIFTVCFLSSGRNLSCVSLSQISCRKWIFGFSIITFFHCLRPCTDRQRTVQGLCCPIACWANGIHCVHWLNRSTVSKFI